MIISFCSNFGVFPMFLYESWSIDFNFYIKVSTTPKSGRLSENITIIYRLIRTDGKTSWTISISIHMGNWFVNMGTHAQVVFVHEYRWISVHFYRRRPNKYYRFSTFLGFRVIVLLLVCLMFYKYITYVKTLFFLIYWFCHSLLDSLFLPYL